MQLADGVMKSGERLSAKKKKNELQKLRLAWHGGLAIMPIRAQ